jgi:general secretion pathway protein G
MMIPAARHPGGAAARRARRGFTLIELLIAIAIIIVLLSILVIAVNAATRTGQSANTRALLNTLEQGLTQFRNDIGYYPPVLGPSRALVPVPPEPDDLGVLNRGAVQVWYSWTTLAEYLLGYDDRLMDGYGAAPADPPTHPERPLLGLRSPGPDGVWNATMNVVNPGARNPVASGKVYGPYIDLRDVRMLGCIDPGAKYDDTRPIPVSFPGETGYNDDFPKVICDYWGQPIRYYRRWYPQSMLQAGYRPTDRNGDGAVDPVPTLSQVFLLRPWTIMPSEGINSTPDDASGGGGGGGDPSSVTALETAEAALFSPGPDRSNTRMVRRDEDEFNEDNIVELLP